MSLLLYLIGGNGTSEEEDIRLDDFEVDSDIYNLSGDENMEEDAFSLNDINSEPEQLEEDPTPDALDDNLQSRAGMTQ